MASTTIDLTNIPSDYSQALLNLDFTYAKDRRARRYVHKQYQKQKKLAADNLNHWFRQFNAKLINQIDEFIKNSMDIDGEGLFPNMHSNNISAISLVLGLHVGDHKATLDLIEEHVHDNYEDIKTYRVGSDYVKRAHFIDLIQDIRDYSNVLIIIEQLEVMDRFLLKIFITILYDLLDETDLNRAMVLFGLSTNLEELGSILPVGALNRIKMRGTIVKETHHDMSTIIQEKLLTVDEYNTRLGYRIYNYIYDSVLERDLSIVNLSYLFQYCLLEHNLDSKAILKLPKNQLTQLLKSDPLVIMNKLNHPKFDPKTLIKPEEVATLIVKSIQQVKTYFKYVWSQIHCYFILLRDETGNVFPSDIFEIYQELMNPEMQTLGNSPLLIDATYSLTKFPTDRLIKRLNLCCSQIDTLNGSLHKGDIRSNLLKLRDKIINNDEYEEFRKELRNELLNHAATLINPMRHLMSDLVYFDDWKSIMKRTMPCTRLEASKFFIDKTSCFGILYGLIHNGTEEMNLVDLYEDFSSAVDENHVIKPPSNERKSLGLKLKTTAKRSARLHSLAIESNITPSSSPPFEITGLKKAIFIDLIECMVYQGLITKDTRQSKRGTIRRCVWL